MPQDEPGAPDPPQLEPSSFIGDAWEALHAPLEGFMNMTHEHATNVVLTVLALLTVLVLRRWVIRPISGTFSKEDVQVTTQVV